MLPLQKTLLACLAFSFFIGYSSSLLAQTSVGEYESKIPPAIMPPMPTQYPRLVRYRSALRHHFYVQKNGLSVEEVPPPFLFLRKSTQLQLTTKLSKEHLAS